MTTWPKGLTAKERRRSKVTAFQAARKACVSAVFARESSKCEACHRVVLHCQQHGVTIFNAGHVHEEPHRSLGGDPTDPGHCHLLCPQCHHEAHGLSVASPVPISRRKA